MLLGVISFNTDTIHHTFQESSGKYFIFQHYHNIEYSGIKSPVKLISSKFIWSNTNKNAQEWAKTCETCQSNKITKHAKLSLENFPKTESCFSVVNTDIIRPSPSDDFVYCLTFIDNLSNGQKQFFYATVQKRQ